MTAIPLPAPTAKLIDDAGRADRIWYNYFSGLNRSVLAATATIVPSGIDDTDAIQALLDAGAEPDPAPTSDFPFYFPRSVVSLPPGDFLISEPLVIPAGVRLIMDSGTKITATATMDAMLTTAEATSDDQHNKGLIQGGVLDADEKADCTIWPKYFADFHINSVISLNPVKRHFRLGSSTAPASSYGMIIRDCLLRRKLTAFPSGCDGIFADTCGDSHIVDTMIMGVRYGVNGVWNDSKISRVHVWNPPLTAPSPLDTTVALSIGFALNGSDNILSQCQVDGPIVDSGAGYFIMQPRTQLIGCSVNYFGNDLTVNGVFIDSGASYSTVMGCTFKGASGSERLAVDIGGTTTNLCAIGNRSSNCGSKFGYQQGAD